MRTSWLLMIASSPFLSQNLLVMSGPNWRPTPLLLGPLPSSSCGSVHSISIISPAWPGCRWLCLFSFRMSSSVILSSEKRPPWRTRYFEPTSVASGNAEKLSEKSLKVLGWVFFMLADGGRGINRKIRFRGGKRMGAAGLTSRCTSPCTRPRSRRRGSCRPSHGCRG